MVRFCHQYINMSIRARMATRGVIFLDKTENFRQVISQMYFLFDWNPCVQYIHVQYNMPVHKEQE